MDMTMILGALVVVNIIAVVAMRMRKPATATPAGGMTVEAAQAAYEAGKNERFGMLERLMRRQKGAGKIQRNLVTAGLMIKPGEFAAMNIAFFIVWMILYLIYMSRVPAAASFFATLKQLIALAAIIWMGWNIPRWILQFLADKRRTVLEVQLADALAMISSGLKGGYSFIQGLSMASDQMPPPISDEFKRTVRLIQLGVDTPRALEQMAQRINSYDYDMTVSATNIQLSSGGNLSALLEGIATTIRDRIRLRRDIAALTAQGRISGGILIALPIGIGVMLNIINREYFSPLYTSDLGLNILYGAGGLQLCGVYWIKKLLDFDS